MPAPVWNPAKPIANRLDHVVGATPNTCQSDRVERNLLRVVGPRDAEPLYGVNHLEARSAYADSPVRAGPRFVNRRKPSSDGKVRKCRH